MIAQKYGNDIYFKLGRLSSDIVNKILSFQHKIIIKRRVDYFGKNVYIWHGQFACRQNMFSWLFKRYMSTGLVQKAIGYNNNKLLLVSEIQVIWIIRDKKNFLNYIYKGRSSVDPRRFSCLCNHKFQGIFLHLS